MRDGFADLAGAEKDQWGHGVISEQRAASRRRHEYRAKSCRNTGCISTFRWYNSDEMTKITTNRRPTMEQQRLLALLRRNARESTASLARKLGLARTTVQERISRLERDGVIAGYTVRVSEGFARQRIAAQVLINVDPKAGARVVRELESRPWVRAVYALSGVFDYEVRIEGGSTEEIDDNLDAIGRIEGIQRTQTSIVLSVKFER
jgi:DNA-binding Lrp family transcriptional regulator